MPGSTNIGSLVATIGVNWDDLTKAERQVRSFVGGVESRFMSLTKPLRSIQGQFAALGVAVGAAGMAKHFIDTASSFELMQIKLGALYHDMDKGKKVFDELNQWAMKMPVDTKTAIDTFVMMQAMGINPTIKLLETLTDVSVLFGAETLPRMARALGQMSSRTKVAQEEINQMRDAGVNAGKYLKQAFGTDVAESLQKMGVTGKMAFDVIVKGLDKEFGGAARAAQNTWVGLVETFKSYVGEIERQVAEAGAFQALKDALGAINTELESWMQNNSELIKQKVPEYVQGIEDKVRAVANIYRSLPEGAVGAAGVGIVGRILFGGAGGVALGAGFYAVQKGLADLNSGVGMSRVLANQLAMVQESMDRMGDISQVHGPGAGEAKARYDQLLTQRDLLVKSIQEENRLRQLQGAPSGTGVKKDSDVIARLAAAREAAEALGATAPEDPAIAKAAKKRKDALQDMIEDQQKLTMSSFEYDKWAADQYLQTQQDKWGKDEVMMTQAKATYQAKMWDADKKKIIAQFEADREYMKAVQEMNEKEVEEAKNKKQMLDQLANDTAKASMDDFDYKRYALDQEVELFKTKWQEKWELTKDVMDKIAAYHAAQTAKINEDEEKAAKKTAKGFWKEVSDASDGWARDWSKNLNDMLWGAELTFGSIAEEFAKMLTQMMIQTQIVAPMINSLGTVKWGDVGSSIWNFLFEHGGAFSNGRLHAFASGGLVRKPTIFPFAGGVGLMGEAGDEAIMPLARTRSGDLGVKSVGGGGGNVNIEIINNSQNAQARVTRQQKSGADMDITVAIDEMMATAVGNRGKTFQSIKRVFGLRDSIIGR